MLLLTIWLAFSSGSLFAPPRTSSTFRIYACHPAQNNPRALPRQVQSDFYSEEFWSWLLRDGSVSQLLLSIPYEQHFV
jgi:transcriptional regulator of nitric oxide reductase